jgi:hypothetical protein
MHLVGIYILKIFLSGASSCNIHSIITEGLNEHGEYAYWLGESSFIP